MHAARPSCDSAKESTEPDRNCAMRGTCDGPTALATLLSNHGVLTESFELSPDRRTTSPAVTLRENLTGRLASPDPPPPRA
jgi:hypothetical protein